MYSYDEWNEMGYQVIRGEKGHWDHEAQEVLFYENQVNLVDKVKADNYSKRQRETMLRWHERRNRC